MIRLTAERTPAGTSYLATGQGHPVVLIHGVGLNKEMWGGQIVGLAPHFQVIAYDMLGHGASPRPQPGTITRAPRGPRALPAASHATSGSAGSRSSQPSSP